MAEGQPASDSAVTVKARAAVVWEDMDRVDLIKQIKKQLMFLQKTKVKCDDLVSKNAVLTNELKDKDEECTMLLEKLKLVDEEQSEDCQRISNLVAEKSKLNNQIQNLEEQLGCMQMKQETVLTTFQCLQEEVNQLQTTNKNLKSELSVLEDARDQALISLRAVKDSLSNEYKNEILKHEETISDLNQRLASALSNLAEKSDLEKSVGEATCTSERDANSSSRALAEMTLLCDALKEEVKQCKNELYISNAGLSESKILYDEVINEKNVALSEKSGAISEMDNTIIKMNDAISEMNVLIAEKDATINGIDDLICENNAIIAEKNAAIAEKDAAIAEKDAAIAEMKAIIQKKDDIIENISRMAENDAEIATKAAYHARMDEIIANNIIDKNEATIAAKDAAIAEMKAIIEGKDEFSEIYAIIAEKNASIAEKDAAIAEKDDAIAEMKAIIEIKDEIIKNNSRIAKENAAIAATAAMHARMDEIILNSIIADKDAIAEKDAVIAEMKAIIETKDEFSENNAIIAEKNASIAEKDGAMAAMHTRMDEIIQNSIIADKEAIAEKDAAIAKMKAIIETKDKFSENNAIIAEKNASIAEKDSAIAEKDAAIAEMKTIIERKDEIIENNSIIAKENAAIATKAAMHARMDEIIQNSTIAEKKATIAGKDAEIAAKDAVIAEMEAIIEGKDEFNEMNVIIAEKNASIAKKDAVIAQKNAEIADWKASMERNYEINENNSIIAAEKNAEIAKKDAAIAEKDAAIAKKDAAIAENAAAISENNSITVVKNAAAINSIINGQKVSISGDPKEKLDQLETERQEMSNTISELECAIQRLEAKVLDLENESRVTLPVVGFDDTLVVAHTSGLIETRNESGQVCDYVLSQLDDDLEQPRTIPAVREGICGAPCCPPMESVGKCHASMQTVIDQESVPEKVSANVYTETDDDLPRWPVTVHAEVQMGAPTPADPQVVVPFHPVETCKAQSEKFISELEALHDGLGRAVAGLRVLLGSLVRLEIECHCEPQAVGLGSAFDLLDGPAISCSAEIAEESQFAVPLYLRSLQRTSDLINSVQSFLCNWLEQCATCLIRSLSESDANIVRLQDQVEASVKSLGESELIVSKYKNIAVKGKKEIVELKKKMSETSDELQKTVADLGHHRAQMERLSSQLSSSLKEKLSAEERCRVAEAKLGVEKERHKSTLVKLDQASREANQSNVISLEIADYERLVQDLNKKIAGQNQELQKVREEMTFQIEKSQGLQTEIEQLEKRIEQSEARGEQLKELSVKQKKELADLRKAEGELKTTEGILKANLELSSQEIENYKLQLAEATADANKQQAAARKAQDANQRAIDNLESRIGKLMEEQRKLKEEYDACQVDYESYKVRVHSVLKQQKSKSSLAVSGGSPESEEFGMKEKEQLDSMVLVLRAKVQELSSKLSVSQSELESLQDQHNSVLKRHNKLVISFNEQEASWRQRIEHLQKELLNEQRENANTVQRMGTQQQQSLASSLKQQTDRLEKQHEQELELVRARLVATQEELARTQKELTDSRGAVLGQPRDDEGQVLDIRNTERQEGEGSEFTDSVFGTSSKQNAGFVPLEQLLNQDDRISDDSFTSADLEKMESRLAVSLKKIEHLTELLNESEATNAHMAEQTRVLKEEIRRLERNQEREQHFANMEYLKNIVVKFLSLPCGDERERLVPVITTILKLSPEEQQTVQLIAKGEVEPPAAASWSSYWPIWPGGN